MTNQARELTKTDQADIREARLAKVLVYHSHGFSEREIADKLLVSKTTVHNDLIDLRNEARQQLQDHIEGLPHAWQIAHNTINLIIKNVWELAEHTDIEFDQALAAYKTLADLNSSRFTLHADPSVINLATALKPKPQTPAVIHEQPKPVYEVIVSEQTASGKRGTITRKAVKKKVVR